MKNFIGVDWGTSSFRAYRVVDGAVVERRASADGILTVAPGGHAATLGARLAGWSTDGAIVLSGMIGSRQGWREASYAPCPADPTAVARERIAWREPGLGDIILLPGLVTHDARGVPDVMRGEETQVFGAMHALGVDEGTFILPGTHSKRVDVRGGRIESFSTFMTGEVFAALRDHTILGRLMEAERAPGDGSGFKRGVEEGARAGPCGDLLHRLFAVRTLGLFAQLPPTELPDYLSGLLIGAELAASLAPRSPGAYAIGSGELTRRYQTGAEILGFALKAAPEDSVVLGQRFIMDHAI